MSSKNVSLKAIASQLNVSINTVSHALRDMDDISEELKVKIRQKAIELGYMPNHIAQSMKKDEKPVIAILVDSLANLYFNTFCQTLSQMIREKDEYGFLFLYSSGSQIDALKQCVLQRVDMVITHRDLESKTYEFAEMNNIKIVFVGSKCQREGIDTVAIDNKMGCLLAARYLSNFHNGEKYVYVGIDYQLSHERYEYFRKELESIKKNCVVTYFGGDKEDIHVLFSMIANGCKNIFFYNDMLAYEVLSKLDQLALDIRKLFPDMHLVGFDGLCETVYGLKQITTIKIDFTKFADATYQVIKNRLENPDIGIQQMILPVTLHQRIV